MSRCAIPFRLAPYKIKFLLVAGLLARVTGFTPVSRTTRPDCQILLCPPVSPGSYRMARIWILYGSRVEASHIRCPPSTWRLSGTPMHTGSSPPYKRLRGKSPAVGYGYPSRPHLPGKAVTSTPGLCKWYYRAQRPLVVLSASKQSRVIYCRWLRHRCACSPFAKLYNLDTWHSGSTSNYWCQGLPFVPLYQCTAHREKSQQLTALLDNPKSRSCRLNGPFVRCVRSRTRRSKVFPATYILYS